MKKVLISAIILFSSLSLFARDITIYVSDIDLDLPLEGALIISWDGGRYICDKEGKAVIQVPERQIAIQASYPGYETGRIVIPVSGDRFTIRLRLSGVMQNRELVIEASRPGSSESRSGRSVAVTEREISQTAQIGIIEDVMSTIKLLPGVSYTGVFGAQPSIRGGYPGDLSASLDGFYINNPYHWGGEFSIFDPRMVQSAQLSHGVFSSRYGHTISGLLKIASKDASFTETQFELGINTSAANFNLSLPLFGKGGILFMGRITYYDPVIDLAKLLSNEIPDLQIVNSIKQAPFIRSTAISGNYRFTNNLEMFLTSFFGMDGVGVNFFNTSRSASLNSDTSLDLDFINYQGFLTSSLYWNPRSDMLFKVSLGTGFEDTIIDGFTQYRISYKELTDGFVSKYPSIIDYLGGNAHYEFEQDLLIKQSDFLFNAQGRIDFDWEISERLLIAAGLQEMFNVSKSTGDQEAKEELYFYSSRLNIDDKQSILDLFASKGISPDDPLWINLIVEIPRTYSPDSENKLFTTSGYLLSEYSSPSNRFKMELGLRIDHFYLLGNGFTASSNPVFNPRINFDFNIFKFDNIVKSFDITLGTGLFSSINSNVFSAEERFNVNHIKPNRSWTSVLGLKFEFADLLTLNIEGYYKYVFDRMYITIGSSLNGDVDILPHFDGEGYVWGIDAMLHKVHSRYWDGWLSYSYNWTNYRDPSGLTGGMGISGGNMGNGWYFPYYHRFHTLNMVFNYRPAVNLNLYIRFGIASGAPLSRRTGDGPVSYPVLIYDRNNQEDSYFIEKFYWPSRLDTANRTTPSLPLDIKFSIYGSNKTGKTRYEVYVAVENVLSLLYNSQGNTSFNQYTGQVDTGSNSASYDIPIPIPSFGVKISY